MEFDYKLMDYLKDNKFSNGIDVIISHPENFIPTRFSLIEELVKESKVIHLGFGDHSVEQIEKKLKTGKWLHSRLCQITKRCLGIDINSEIVEYSKHRLGYEDVICDNLIENKINEIINDNWDYIILGEVLEHIDNPILFLTGIREKYQKSIKKMIITVPNAFSLFNFRMVKEHKELINSDHRFWFTPYTLAKCITIAGMRINRFSFCLESELKFGHVGKYKFKNIKKRYLLKKYPAFRDTLLIEVKL